MFIDGLMLFTGTSNGATGGITSGANTDSPTTGTQVASNIIDLGVTSGIPSSAAGGGARDIGIGDARALKLSAIVTTAFTLGTSLSLTLQGAPDNGSGAPSASWTTMWQSPAAVVEASLIQGAQLANVDVPRVVFEQVMPRFLRMQFVSSGTHTTGAIECWVALDLDQQVIGPTGFQSNYPAGVVVAN
jgi:hypothetical protein